MNSLIKQSGFCNPNDCLDGFPHCNICNQPVGEFHIEYPLEIKSIYPYIQKGHTGEIIITIKCHGDLFKISNWRGILASVICYPKRRRA